MKANDDISSRPAKVIRTELCEVKRDNLQPADLKRMRQALYTERRKRHSTSTFV